LDQVAEKRYVFGNIEKLHEPRARFQQACRGLSDGNAAPLRRDIRFWQILTIKNLSHNRHIEAK
jgi:hypothetical protein